LTEEKASVSFQDSAIIGDVTVTQNNAECPSCSASNVRVMKCHEVNCEIRFCELCHPKCRYSEGRFLRFDSGEGLGPFCKGCGTIKFTAWKIIQERLRSEREAIEIQELQERLARESIETDERLAREAIETDEKLAREVIELQVKQERYSRDKKKQKIIKLEEKYLNKWQIYCFILGSLVVVFINILYPEKADRNGTMFYGLVFICISLCCYSPLFLGFISGTSVFSKYVIWRERNKPNQGE